MDRMRVDIKTRTAGSKGTVGYRLKQAEKRAVARSTARSNAFDRGRNMGPVNAIDALDEEEPQSENKNVKTKEEKTSVVADPRRIRLDKWREEKLQKIALQKSQQKPVFKTGVVHHSVGSPDVFGVPTSATSAHKIAPIKTVESSRVLRPRNGVATRAIKNTVSNPIKPVSIQAIPVDKKFVAPKGIRNVAWLTEPTTPQGMSDRKKLQAKAFENKQPSASGASRSPVLPSSTGKIKDRNLKRPLFAPKSATPNVNTQKRVKPEAPLHSNLLGSSNAAKLRPAPVAPSPWKRKPAVKSVSTPKVGVSGKINSAYKPASTPSLGLNKKAVLVDKSKMPHNDNVPVAASDNDEVPVAASDLPSSKGAVSEPLSEDIHDSQTLPCFQLVTKTHSARISLNFKPSPNVTIERGKYSDRRKSSKSRLTNNHSPLAFPIESPSTSEYDIPTDNHIEVDSQQPGVRYRNILNSEVVRLNVLCTEWAGIRSEHVTQLSENINSLIDLAIGQTQLLIRSKFEQFRGLTYDYENGVCVPPVTEEDLQGFWEMVYIQVENIDKQFSQLNELKQNHFVEKSPSKVVAQNKNQKKKSKPKAPKMTKSSGIRALIAAQRQKQLQQDTATKLVVTPKLTPRYSKISGSATQSGGRRSLLKDVLNSSAVRRSQHLSPIIMRVSQLAKNVGSPSASDKLSIENVQPLTPYRSILKDVSLIGSYTKESRKTVNFGENTIRNLTPDVEGFQSPVDEPLASDVDSADQVQKDVVSDIPPTGTENVPVPVLEKEPPSPKRRTRGSALNKTSVAAETQRKGRENEMLLQMEKENQSTDSPVPKQTRTRRTRKSVLTFVEVEINDSTPVMIKTRRSYRKTPYKTTLQNDNKTSESVPEPMPDISSTQGVSLMESDGTPTTVRPRRSYRKTPYAEKTSQSSGEERLSLLPVTELEPSPAMATRFSTGDLISFATPQRRSSRVSKKK